MKKYTGFTLAEVLITLGIIGVVSALTIPALIGKYKEKQRVTQVKKVYSVLSQAFNMAKNEYGSPENWAISTTVTGETDEEDYSKSSTLVRDIFAKYIKNTSNKKHTFRKYVSLDGRNFSTSGNSSIGGNNSALYLADGTMISFGWMTEGCKNEAVECGDIFVFLPEKDAQLGVSEFNFYISPKGIMPYGHSKHFIRSFEKYCDITNKNGIASNDQGRSCTAWVLYNENMDYLHCSDLSWDGKHSCK
ncbi:MAG: type II secretion system protein [Brachyspira sp.]|nr:type II secretion system protein [Brachyspira sp.]